MNFDSQPRYSPDGSKIVFLSDRSGDENIWIANQDGTDPRPLTKGKNTRYWSPEWTPDGKYIVVSRSGTATTGTQLWLYHVDGGNGVNLTGKRGAPAAQPVGRSVRQGRSVRLLHRAHGGRQCLQPDDLPLAARRVRPPDGRELPHERRARKRDAAGALA